MGILALLRSAVLLSLLSAVPLGAAGQFWRKNKSGTGADSVQSAPQQIEAKAPAQPWPGRNFPGNRFYVGLGFGGVQYTGDLTTRDGSQGFGPLVNLTFGFGGRKLLSTVFQAGYAQFSADDPLLNPLGTSAPNTYVNTSYLFVEGLVRARFRRERSVRPHLGIGLGYLRFTAEDQRGNELADQAATRSVGETVSNGSLQMPLNFGFVCDLSDRLAISLDYYRVMPFTDYLDNIAELGPDSGNDTLNRLQLSLLVGIN